jgi:ribosome maturation factor RimP
VIPQARFDQIQTWISKQLADFKTKAGEPIEAYLIEVLMRNYNGMEYLEIFIDTDSGVTIDQCASFSRILSSQLETEPHLAEMFPLAFRLEVSSPGLGRPLKWERQYVKNIGRTLAVKYKDTEGKYLTVEGKLLAVENGALDLAIAPPKKVSQKKAAVETEIVTLLLETVVEAKVQPKL